MSNVVLLMSDEHNPFFSSVYGHKFIKTPNMDRLAEIGTTYENSYCPSPLCQPSRSAFMAGRRVHEVQVYNNCNAGLRSDFPSYGKILADQDIYTAYIGKTDVYARAKELGFSEMILPGERSRPGDINFSRKPLTIREGAAGRADGFGVKEGAFDHDDEKIAAAINWLKNKAPQLNQTWSLTVNITSPHFPHYVTEELWKMYLEGDDLPLYRRECESANHPYARDLRDHFEADLFTEEQERGLRRGYLGCVTYVDQQIGKLLDILEDTGQMEDTVFIYTSDHGDMLGKFGMWWKCSLYEDSVRVPVLAAGPGFDAGQVVQTPVDLLNVQATIFAATGTNRPDEWTGAQLQNIPVDDNERVVFSEYHGHGTRAGAYMVRKGDWKLIYYMEAENQLFNLSEDPDELNNLYQQYPEKVNELENELRNICDPAKEDQRAKDFEKKQLKIINS